MIFNRTLQYTSVPSTCKKRLTQTISHFTNYFAQVILYFIYTHPSTFNIHKTFYISYEQTILHRPSYM